MWVDVVYRPFETCDRLAKTYGPRFVPPKSLREMAASGGSYYAKAGASQAA